MIAVLPSRCSAGALIDARSGRTFPVPGRCRKDVAILRQGGHQVVAGSPKSGINSITGVGLKEAMAGAQVVIDLANSPSFEDVPLSRRRPQPASGTTSRYPSSQSTGPTMAISAPRSPRRN